MVRSSRGGLSRTAISRDEIELTVLRTRYPRPLMWLVALVAMHLCACGVPRYDPFHTPASELRQRIQTIAVAPLAASSEFIDRDRLRSQVEPLVADRLRAGAFEVIPSDEVGRLLEQVGREVGDVFDPLTGEVDDERFDLVRGAVYRDLAAQHGVDAVLYIWLEVVPLYLVGSSVSYCGLTGDKPYWPGTGWGPSFWFESATVVSAFCLNVSLYDLERRKLYSIRYGLETFETYHSQTRAVRPKEERLRDLTRIGAAVEVTIGPLADSNR